MGQQLDRWYNVLYQPLGFFIFLVCAFAECNRTPFDLPEAENELNFGYHQEYSSMKLGFYLFAEYINMFISSAVMVTLFWGGYDIPFVSDANLLERDGTELAGGITGALFVFKDRDLSFSLLCGFAGPFPDSGMTSLMNLGWKTLIPLALINMIITALSCIA